MKAEELKNLIIKEHKKGNIVVSTVDGLKIAPLKEIIKQPASGLLYDLNRDEATILTLIDDPKWVNDYACMVVIRELKKQIELSESYAQENRREQREADNKIFKDSMEVRLSILVKAALMEINETPLVTTKTDK